MNEISNRIRRLGVYYDKRGLLGLVKHIVGNLFYHYKWTVFEWDVAGEHTTVQAKIPVNIRLLSDSEEEIDRLTDFWPEVYSPEFSTRQTIKERIQDLIDTGGKCMIAEYNGEIIHMNWMAFSTTHDYQGYEKKRKLSNDEARSFYVYCSENYRGNSIMGAVRTRVADYLAENKYKKLITYVRSNNTPAIKVNARSSGKPRKYLYIIKILGFTFNISKRIK